MSISAVFYKASDEMNSYEKHVPAPYIRGSYVFDRSKKCSITVTGLGFYDLFVNGKKITKGLLAPYISNPDDVVYFDRYDITSLIGEAEETAIGLILGNGMQNCPGGRVWDFDIAPFRNPPCFALLVTEEDGEGNEKTLDIGASFRWSPSPVIFDDLRSGCFYDAGKEIKDWNKPGFDFSSWDKVRKADRPRGEYRYCQADPIEVYNELKA
ncbi:MAG: alpha-L-rhamnosidase N-terminal domain-containing protein, partial [Clostridia bacterium]|nr:alpha-L-rhamnosidase N-terminal domain-containing protein [Clostridia bacterium]